MNSNINYINNKPLKCVITNNRNSTKYFGSVNNSKEPYAGTLIIYEDPNVLSNETGNKSGYREIYLNEKFLAGGYGFKTEELLNKAITIINEYYTTIGRIDDTESTTSKYLQDQINKKLDKEGDNADASKVYFIYDDSKHKQKLYIKDIIELLSKIPQYKDLELTSAICEFSYIGYDDNNDNLSTCEVDINNINDFTLPINAKLARIKLNLSFNVNHAGGIEYISIKYKKTNTDNSDIFESNYNVNILPVDNIDLPIVLRYNTNEPYIIDENNETITNIELSVLGTPPTKYQDVLLSNGASVCYYANSIQNYLKVIDFPAIKGSYYLAYSTTSNNPTANLELNQTSIFNSKYYEKILVNNDNDNKFTYINIDSGIKQVVVILPYKFKIRQAILINDSNEINITNFLNYYPYNENNFIQNNLRSCLYYIRISEGLRNQYKLKLDIIEDNTIGYNDMNINYPNTISFINTTRIYVLNSDEIHKYWVNESNIDSLDTIVNYDEL